MKKPPSSESKEEYDHPMLTKYYKFHDNSTLLEMINFNCHKFMDLYSMFSNNIQSYTYTGKGRKVN